jgi:osmotically-inducible protein OsmY
MSKRRRARPLHALLALLVTLSPMVVRPAVAQDARQLKRNVAGPGDYTLRETLAYRIGRDPGLARERITMVLVNSGVVFSGSISSYALKMRLLRIAGFTRGVRNITDEMTVQRAELPDAALRDAVVDALSEASEELGLTDLEVEVEDAVATLRGRLRQFPSRIRAEVLTGSVLGVRRIVNRLIPDDVPKLDDYPSLAAAVAAYLKDFRAFPHTGQLEVTEADGTITLGGRVPFYTSRRYAEVLIGLVDGVRIVENRIKVDPSLVLKRIDVKVMK